MKSYYKFLLDFFREAGLNDFLEKPVAAIVCLVSIILVAWLAHFITRKIILKIVNRIAQKTKTEWDDIMVKNKVFKGLAHLVPAFILYFSYNFSAPAIMPDLNDPSQSALIAELAKDYYFSLPSFLHIVSKLYFILIIIYVTNSLLNSATDIYNTTDFSHHRSIKGYIQLLKILVYFMGAILIISAILNQNPTVLLAWLGTMAAVLLLVFKDTILGFVASIQLSANNMAKIGDWIAMPSHNADGTILDITLNTVKVQNWDKTITTIPTYALVSESFYNWKGMEESGGRRIKRSVSIDTNTIKFCNEAMLERFEKFDLIRDYVHVKEKELQEYNKGKNISEEDYISGRHQTNVGIFRKYLEVYLQDNPKIHKGMTFLVRQLQPMGKGLPIEIYVFSNDQAWANYETIQADIFDHIYAVIPEFELRVYQEPSGVDFSKIIN